MQANLLHLENSVKTCVQDIGVHAKRSKGLLGEWTMTSSVATNLQWASYRVCHFRLAKTGRCKAEDILQGMGHLVRLQIASV